ALPVCGTEDAVRGTVADDAVAHGDVVRLAEHARRSAAAHVEPLEHDVVGLLELDGVRAAAQHRPGRPDRTVPAERHRIAGRATIAAAHDDVAAIGGAAVDQDDIAGFQVDAVYQRRELGVLPAR